MGRLGIEKIKPGSKKRTREMMKKNEKEGYLKAKSVISRGKSISRKNKAINQNFLQEI